MSGFCLIGGVIAFGRLHRDSDEEIFVVAKREAEFKIKVFGRLLGLELLVYAVFMYFRIQHFRTWGLPDLALSSAFAGGATCAFVEPDEQDDAEVECTDNTDKSEAGFQRHVHGVEQRGIQPADENEKQAEAQQSGPTLEGMPQAQLVEGCSRTALDLRNQQPFVGFRRRPEQHGDQCQPAEKGEDELKSDDEKDQSPRLVSDGGQDVAEPGERAGRNAQQAVEQIALTDGVEQILLVGAVAGIAQ